MSAIAGRLPADRSVTVVGGGFGGLATAAYLARAGADVTLLEQHPELGGHAGTLTADGFRFDTGPSWYLMPDVFERFFDHFDREPTAYYGLERLDPQYRVFWKDGDHATVRPDRDQVRALFDSYEPGAGAKLDDYLATARENYELAMDRVVYEDPTRFRELLDPSLAPLVPKVELFRSMDGFVGARFDHPKLQQLLQYTLVFLGGAPHNTPALYHIMSHVDLNLNVFYPEGGIHGVVEAIADLAREQGARIETGVEVERIRGYAGNFRLDTDAGTRSTDVVVSNANPAYTERELLASTARDHDPSYWDDRTYAPSAFMLYLGVEGDVEPLAHHTLVLPTDWDGHFRQIFERPAWPDDPAYYLSVASKSDDTVAPEGHHAVVVLVPIAPGLDDGPDRREQYRDAVLADLAERTGVDLRDRIVLERSACVTEFAQRYGDPQGSALGLAHTLFQTGPFRPGHRADRDGLYYTGAYTTPGIGMPMPLISGEHTARDVVADHPIERTASAGIRGRLGQD